MIHPQVSKASLTSGCQIGSGGVSRREPFQWNCHCHNRLEKLEPVRYR